MKDEELKIERQKFQMHSKGYKDITDAIKEAREPEVNEIGENVTMVISGRRGPQGKPGEKPTKEELIALIEPRLPDEDKLKSIIIPLIPKPIKGEDGKSIRGPQGKPGRTPIKGIDFHDGKDGYTPKKGKDYFDGRDGEPGKDVTEVDADKLVEKLQGVKKQWLSIEAIDGDFNKKIRQIVHTGGATGITEAPVDDNSYIRKNAKWELQTDIANGDVVGPASATDGNIPLFDTTTGKKIKDSGISLSDLAPALTSDENYVTDAEKANLHAPGSDDQDLSGLQPKLTCVSKIANYTAQPFELVNCDISAGSFKVTLPSAPADKTVIYVKLNAIGTNRVLTLATSGTDKFNTPTGTVEIYMTLFGEYAQLQYCATSGLWSTFIASATYNYATNFPGIDATTPISNADITIDTSTRVLTIVPPLGYFNIFVDGGGVITRFREVGTITFPAFTDTSGTWFFYFNSSGVAVTTQTPWTASDFPSIAAIYRIVWNATLVGSSKLVAQYVEYHQNTIPVDTHEWMHLNGAIWGGGLGNGDIKTNALVTGVPNADGRNSVIAITTAKNIDDNLEYTVTNDSTPTDPWQQDMGDIVPATLNATNGGQFKTFVQDAGALISFLPATRFPFPWDNSTNVPQYITSTGTRTPVADKEFFVVFVYATQNPVAGEALKVVTSTASFGTITNARAYNWADVQSAYTILGTDGEIRPMYRLIFEYRASYNVGAKYSVLRETQDIRKTVTTSTTTATGSLPASSVTFVPAGNIASTNTQSAIEELDTEKASLVSPSFTSPTIGGVEIPSTTSTSTLTNKRVNPRIVSAASYTTDTGTSLSIATCDEFIVTAQAGALKLNNPGGTPVEGNRLIIRIKDNGTARALTYDTQFRAMGVALPTTTVLSKTMYMGFIYNSTDTKWDLVAVAQEA